MIRLITCAVLAHIAYAGIEEIPLPSDIQGCFDREYTKGEVTFFLVSVYSFKSDAIIANLSTTFEITILSSTTGSSVYICKMFSGPRMRKWPYFLCCSQNLLHDSVTYLYKSILSPFFPVTSINVIVSNVVGNLTIHIGEKLVWHCVQGSLWTRLGVSEKQMPKIAMKWFADLIHKSVR